MREGCTALMGSSVHGANGYGFLDDASFRHQDMPKIQCLDQHMVFYASSPGLAPSMSMSRDERCKYVKPESELVIHVLDDRADEAEEQNKRLELQLSQLQEEIAEKDHEIERLRSAGRLLNAQRYEIRDLKFKLRETFNENAEVPDVCEKLEKEKEAHAARKKVTDEEQNSKALEVQLALLTDQLHNMGVGLPKIAKAHSPPFHECYKDCSSI
ncbi:hypothetical protein AXG93_2318s1080 [Marchantia polymorpha subsp. ruderalis]|uniref:Uncharacterized protein n=1 Tax=Marchantia polymorpha subsp. ruderalis TaxID=1480154 RepID=A0A176VPZ0_MARPO|nr:hypothetical protein AXG93_2318s1080 [Marchantia polymorpha subsp. ruderalis]